MSAEDRGLQEQSPEARQTDLYNKDVGETGRWGSRSKQEIIAVFVLVALIITGTVCGVVFTRGEKQEEPEPSKISYIDENGQRVSSYQLPVPPTTKISDSDELIFLRSHLANYTGYEMVPAKVNALVGKADNVNADPILRAASWLVTVDQTNVQEESLTRFALAVIYYTTGGAGWKNKSGWLTSDNHCKWYGVSCCMEVPASLFCAEHDHYSVSTIDLYDNNLVGTIPLSIELLKDLQSLFMNDNWLTGEIPARAFASLPKFQKLYLSNNKLTGTIPGGILNKYFGKHYESCILVACSSIVF